MVENLTSGALCQSLLLFPLPHCAPWHWRHAAQAAVAPSLPWRSCGPHRRPPAPLSLPLPSSPFSRIEIDRSTLPRPTPIRRRVPHLAVDSGLPEANRRRHPLRLAKLRLPSGGIGLGSPTSSRRHRLPPPGPVADRHVCRRHLPSPSPPSPPTRSW